MSARQLRRRVPSSGMRVWGRRSPRAGHSTCARGHVGLPAALNPTDVSLSLSLGRAYAGWELRPDKQRWAGAWSCAASWPLSWAEDLSQARSFTCGQTSGR